jgi:hypothetical protein
MSRRRRPFNLDKEPTTIADACAFAFAIAACSRAAAVSYSDAVPQDDAVSTTNGSTPDQNPEAEDLERVHELLSNWNWLCCLGLQPPSKTICEEVLRAAANNIRARELKPQELWDKRIRPSKS